MFPKCGGFSIILGIFKEGPWGRQFPMYLHRPNKYILHLTSYMSNVNVADPQVSMPKTELFGKIFMFFKKYVLHFLAEIG